MYSDREMYSGDGRFTLRTAGKNWGLFEAFISSATKVLRERRRGGARELYIIGDLHVELGLMCTDEQDIEELNEMYKPLC